MATGVIFSTFLSALPPSPPPHKKKILDPLLKAMPTKPSLACKESAILTKLSVTQRILFNNFGKKGQLCERTFGLFNSQHICNKSEMHYKGDRQRTNLSLVLKIML